MEVAPHESALRRYLRRSFPALHDVDDVVQESYLRLLTRKSAHPILSAKAFLFAIARRLAIDLGRHHRRSPIALCGDMAGLAVSDDRPAVVALVSHEERVRLLVAAIDSLPGRCREVVILRKLKFTSQKETAARLGVSEKCVENQLHRGLVRCRAYLHRHGVEGFSGHEG